MTQGLWLPPTVPAFPSHTVEMLRTPGASSTDSGGKANKACLQTPPLSAMPSDSLRSFSEPSFCMSYLGKGEDGRSLPQGCQRIMR